MTERENFNTVLKKVLKVSKAEMDRRLEAEKESKKDRSRPLLAGR